MIEPTNSHPLDGRSVLVTGGAGFIGSHLTDALISVGAKVRVLDDFSTGRRTNLEGVTDQIELIEGDIRDFATCVRACTGVSVVFHQAALGSVPRSMKRPAVTLAVNVSGTANLFAAARDAGVERIVYASSSSVYGDSTALPKREGTEGRPLSPYALSKAMCEELADTFGRCFDMELVGLRYFNVYGPRQDPDGPYAAVVPRFFAAYAAGIAPTIHGDGEQMRDFTFVADAVTANLRAATSPASSCGEAYNIGAGGSTSINRLAELIRRQAGGGLGPVHGPPRAGDVRASWADVSKAQRALGFAPTFDLDSGLERTARYFLATGNSPQSTDRSSE